MSNQMENGNFPKPPRFNYSFWCRILGHKWLEASDGWYCWRGGHGLTDEDRLWLRSRYVIGADCAMNEAKELETIFIIRDNMAWMEADLWNYVKSIPAESIAARMRHRVRLVDGTQIIGMPRAMAEQGTRGYSNVRYV
jgi:hypothetical protein